MNWFSRMAEHAANPDKFWREWHRARREKRLAYWERRRREALQQAFHAGRMAQYYMDQICGVRDD